MEAPQAPVPIPPAPVVRRRIEMVTEAAPKPKPRSASPPQPKPKPKKRLSDSAQRRRAYALNMLRESGSGSGGSSSAGSESGGRFDPYYVNDEASILSAGGRLGGGQNATMSYEFTAPYASVAAPERLASRDESAERFEREFAAKIARLPRAPSDFDRRRMREDAEMERRARKHDEMIRDRVLVKVPQRDRYELKAEPTEFEFRAIREAAQKAKTPKSKSKTPKEAKQPKPKRARAPKAPKAPIVLNAEQQAQAAAIRARMEAREAARAAAGK
jgi:hypothetical protein